MKTSIIITNYNYSKFLDEAIRSTLEQEGFDKINEIIVVDDGSTDNSLNLLKKYSNIDKIKIIEKQNGGQLSAFNEAMYHITGDIICFLDADDKYKLDYISTIVDYYSNNPNCDALFVRIEHFGNENYSQKSRPNEDLGYSIFSTYYLKEWIGNVTSAFSIKKGFLQKILPLHEIENEWRVRADDCLVWGSSLVGARKHYLDKILVSYRIHGENNFYGKKYSIDYCVKRNLAIAKFFNLIIEKNKIVLTPTIFKLEFLSKRNKLKEFIKYLKIILLTDFKLIEKISIFLFMIKSLFIKNKPFNC